MKKFTSLLIALSMLTSTAAFAATPENATSVGIIGGADGPTEVIVTETPGVVGGMAESDMKYVSNEILKDYIYNFQPTITYSDEIIAQFGIEGAANVYYNSEYLDPAIIISGRTMLPFRAFLEAVGATVDYDDATRTASAVKKDISVSFNLDSDTIAIATPEGNSEMKMDVKPVIIEGHSYVPIRFLSEAFGMQVGWSGYEQTAVIADFDAYFDQLWASCPNLSKLAEIGVVTPESSYSVASVGLTFNMESGFIDFETGKTYSTDKTNLEASLDAEGTTAGMNADSKLTASVKYSDNEGNTFDLSNCTLDIIFKDNTYYIRTNLLSELAVKGIIDANEIPPSLLNKDTWYEFSLENYFALISSMAGEELDIDVDAMLKIMENATNSKALLEYIYEEMFSSMGEINTTYALDALTQMINAFAIVDKYITITEAGENTYDVAFKLDTDMLIDLAMDIAVKISAEIGEYTPTEEEIAEARKELEESFENLVIDINLTAHIENGITTSQKMYMNVSFEEGADKLKLLLDMTSTVDPNAKVDDIVAPENTVDIFEKIYGI